MKKIILILFLNLLFLSCFSQDSLKKKYHRFGAGFNMHLSAQTSDIGKIPYVLYALPRHKIACGLVIAQRPINKISNISGDHYDATMLSDDKSRIIGANAIYQFIPNPPGKIFDLYFEYRLTWIQMRTEIHYNVATANFHSFESLVSFGMKAKFLKHFSYYLSIGGGEISNIGKYSHYKNIPLYNKPKFSIGLITGLDFHL